MSTNGNGRNRDREFFENTVGTRADLIAANTCTVCIERNASKPRAAYAGFERCWSHMTRSQRTLNNRPSISHRKYGIYTDQLSDAMRKIREDVESRNETHKLYDTSILEELSTSRIFLMSWLERHREDEDIPLKDLLECVNLITKVAKLAQEIQRADQHELSADMRRTIVTLVSYAFHRANLADTVEERALIFTTELSRAFSGKNNHTIENVSEEVLQGTAVAVID